MCRKQPRRDRRGVDSYTVTYGNRTVGGATPRARLGGCERGPPPQHAAGVLTAMPSDRAAVLLKRLEPPDLARILAATDPARKAVLWALLDVERNAAVLAATSMPQAT